MPYGRKTGFRRARRSRVADVALSLILLAALAFAVTWLRDRSAAELTGHPRFADGDSLQFGDRRVRLEGIDAPELDQNCQQQGRAIACGREALNHLASLIDRRQVTCKGNEEDRYGRLLAPCWAGETDLNAAMVRDGWALAYGGYETEEVAARAARRGLWAFSFENPRQWRRDREQYRSVAQIEGPGWIRRTLTKLFAWLNSVLH